MGHSECSERLIAKAGDQVGMNERRVTISTSLGSKRSFNGDDSVA